MSAATFRDKIFELRYNSKASIGTEFHSWKVPDVFRATVMDTISSCKLTAEPTVLLSPASYQRLP